MSDPVTLDFAGSIATITLARPEQMNSLTAAVKAGLLAAVRSAAADVEVRAVVLAGSGRAFCVGQDLREHAANLQTEPPEEVWATVPRHFSAIARTIATMAKPVVAAVNGVAAGAGASIAFACDFRLLADTATFNLAFTGIGLSCDTGASWTLPRLVGHARAVELLMQPRTIGAADAVDLGLATRVVPAGELDAAVDELAGRLAAGPTVAFGAVRRALAYAATHPLDDTLAYEGQLMALTGATEDHRRAVRAFLAKQRPEFHGH